jgi:hypothetical protein
MAILSQERLLKLTGLKQRAALRRHLRRAGVSFSEVNGRILATEEAFSARVAHGKKKKAGINWGHLDASN